MELEPPHHQQLANDAAALWSMSRNITFNHNLSNTQNTIMSHGIFALNTLVDKIDKLITDIENFVPKVENTSLLPTIPDDITAICNIYGIASSILFDSSIKKTKENNAIYNLRIERFNYIKDICVTNSIDTPNLLNRRMRNTIIHIDEYLAKEMRNNKRGWLVDSTILNIDEIVVPNGIELWHCRTLMLQEMKILHFEYELSLPDLRQEAAKLFSAIRGIEISPLPSSSYLISS